MNVNQAQVLSLLNKHEHLLITGGAGTGKSFVTKDFLASANPHRTLICAPTGVAALNVGGQTLHRTFQIPFSLLDPRDQARANSYRINDNKRAVIEMCETLIIDEISMVRADVLDYVDETCRVVRQIKRPFGGIRVVMVGDPFQLPPVTKDKAEENALWFFNSSAFRSLSPRVCNLTEIYRQTDQTFIDILNRMRMGETNEGDLEALNARVVNQTPDDGIVLSPTNASADTVNQRKLGELPAPVFAFEMDVRNYAYGFDITKNLLADVTLRVKVGARVVMLNNDPDERWINGTLGTVTEIRPGAREIVVLLDGGVAPVTVTRFTWQATEARRAGSDYEQEVLGEATQYPLKLGWALTIHKSQGLSFSKCHILPSLIFAAGQAYVAFSRARSLEGLTLQSKLAFKHVMASETVKNFYEEAVG